MRILSFIALFVLGFVGPWWLVAPFAFLYAFRFPAYEILLLAFALDLSYGAGAHALPIRYTLAAALVLVIAALIKPRLRFYTHAPL